MARKKTPKGAPKKSIRKPVPADKLRKSWIALLAFGFLLYANTIPHDYTQDDAIVITANMYTTQGLSGIPGLLSKDTFFGFFKEEGKARLVSGGRYRPLTPIMFAIEYQIFGESPWIGHLVNALLYGLTGVLIFFLLFWMGRNSPWWQRAWEFALIGSLLFIAHPLHTEVVANIKGRDEMMSLLLSLGALWYLVRSWPALNKKHYLLSIGLFFLALFSKENAITFLAVIPLTLYFFTKTSMPRALKTTLPYIGAAVLFLVIRGQVIGWEFGDTPRELLNNPFLKIEGNQYVDFTGSEKLSTITYTLGKYLQLLVFPHPLTHDYYPRHIDLMPWGNGKVLLSLFAYIGMIVMIIRGWKSKRVYAYGMLFFLVTMSIVSNIVFPVGTNMSERFAYMPSLGFAIAVAGTICMGKSFNAKLIFGVVGVVVLAFSIKTVTRNTVWKSNATLFFADVTTSDRSAKLLAAAGGESTAQALRLPEGEERNTLLQQAVGYLQTAQSIHPNYKLSYILIGNAHFYLQNWDEAIAAYQNVLRIKPGDEQGLTNLGIAYRDAGRYYGEKQGNLARAIEYLNLARPYLPNDYETFHALGVAYGMNNQPSQAVEMLKRGVELAPENPTAHYNLGLAYQNAGDLVNAKKHRDIAGQLDPSVLKDRSDNGGQ